MAAYERGNQRQCDVQASNVRFAKGGCRVLSFDRDVYTYPWRKLDDESQFVDHVSKPVMAAIIFRLGEIFGSNVGQAE